APAARATFLTTSPGALTETLATTFAAVFFGVSAVAPRARPRAAAARPVAPRCGARAGGGAAISTHVPSSSSRRACQPQPSRTQRRTVPWRFVSFSVTNGALHRGQGSRTGWSHTANVQSGYRLQL